MEIKLYLEPLLKETEVARLLGCSEKPSANNAPSSKGRPSDDWDAVSGTIRRICAPTLMLGWFVAPTEQ
jgi:hypothetical protein